MSMSMSTTKECSKCGESKPYSEFHKCSHKKDGYNHHCKDCRSKSFKDMRLKDPEGFRLARRQYKRDNVERVRELRKQWRNNNREKWNEMQRKYRSKPQAKVVDALRGRLRRAVKFKHKSALELVGCDISFLMGYLEAQFKDGMTWDNYGEWHIDHIKPCSSFDLLKYEEQLVCFHYSNLQPLWAIENLIKGDRYE